MKCAQKCLPGLSCEHARGIIYFLLHKMTVYVNYHALGSNDFENCICQQRELFRLFDLLLCFCYEKVGMLTLFNELK